jgi:hypothetical protein
MLLALKKTQLVGGKHSSLLPAGAPHSLPCPFSQLGLGPSPLLTPWLSRLLQPFLSISFSLPPLSRSHLPALSAGPQGAL